MYADATYDEGGWYTQVHVYFFNPLTSSFFLVDSIQGVEFF